MDAEMLRDKLSLEVHEADWAVVAPPFARGVLVIVGDELELMDAAIGIAQDRALDVADWLNSGVLRRASDEDAHAFSAERTHFRFVIVAPFVLAKVIPEPLN